MEYYKFVYRVLHYKFCSCFTIRTPIFNPLSHLINLVGKLYLSNIHFESVGKREGHCAKNSILL